MERSAFCRVKADGGNPAIRASPPDAAAVVRKDKRGWSPEEQGVCFAEDPGD